MTDSIQGPSDPNKSLNDRYISDFKKSANLFENALKEYQQTSFDEAAKKEAFKKVMDQSMNIMKETVMETCRKTEQKETEKRLEQDYQTFEKDHAAKNQEALNKDYQTLLKDIEDLQRCLN